MTTIGYPVGPLHAESARRACRLPSAVPPPTLPGRSGISAFGSTFRSDIEYSAPDGSNCSALRHGGTALRSPAVSALSGQCLDRAGRQPMTTMASADFYRPIVTPCDVTSPWAGRQISQGKTRDFPPTYPPHIRRLGPDDIGLQVYWPSRPPRRRLVCGSCSSGQEFACVHAPALVALTLQIPPHDGHPCGSARSSCHQGLHRDFHPASHFLGRFR